MRTTVFWLSGQLQLYTREHSVYFMCSDKPNSARGYFLQHQDMRYLLGGGQAASVGIWQGTAVLVAAIGRRCCGFSSPTIPAEQRLKLS